MGFLMKNLSERDTQTMLGLLNEDADTFSSKFFADPEKTTVRALRVLNTRDPAAKFDLSQTDRRMLVDEIERTFEFKRKPVSVTRATKALEATGHVTQEAAERVYREEASRLSKFVPGMKGRIGPAGPILAIAAILSAGMFAAGMARGEEAA